MQYTVNSYHSWKCAACVESLKSTPMDTVTDACGSKRSEEGEKHLSACGQKQNQKHKQSNVYISRKEGRK